MDDKRNYKRVPVNAIMMYQAKKFPNASMEDLYKIGTPLSVDISHGGLKMTTDQEIKNDVQLHIVLSIVNTNIPIELTGKVIWCKDSETKGHYDIGVEFIEFDDESKKKLIEDFIEKE